MKLFESTTNVNGGPGEYNLQKFANLPQDIEKPT